MVPPPLALVVHTRCRLVPPMALRASALTAPLVASLPARGLSRARLSAGAMSRLSPVAAAVSDAPTSATDNDFSGYVPKTAFLFPGQGAQAVGMAKSLVEEVPAAASMFKRASEILGYDLLDVCVNGPKEKLDSTAVSQPAIYVASLATLEKIKLTEEGRALLASCNVAAGLSLGEYTALAFAGALSFEDGLKLVALRGACMQAAADAQPSAMASVIGLASEQVAALCEAASEQAGPGQGVRVANFLCPGNYAVSGGVKGIEVLESIAKPQFKARMTVRLAVAGAFHTDFMAPAVPKLAAALAATPLQKPRIPVVSNVDAKPHSDPAVIRQLLARQVTAPVQWEATLNTLLAKGLGESVEVGPGKVIAGIMKRISKDAKMTNVEC